MNFWQQLPKPFTVLAPMDGVTDYVFREIIAEAARPDVFFTEFTSTEGLFSKGHEATFTNLKFSERQRPIVAQIWGTRPAAFYKTGQLLRELRFDGIDINMGCPDKNVVKRGAGAALIDNPNLAAELIQATREGSKGLPVSVKTRIGYKQMTTEEWFNFLLKQKLAAITIHGRLAIYKSKSPVLWSEIRKAVRIRDELNSQTVIIGNGDVESYQDVIEKHRDYLVDGVMIGRGIFANPWVFNKTDSYEDHSAVASLELLLKHTKLYEDTWGDSKNFEVLKKFFKMYVKNFRGADTLRQSLMTCHNSVEVTTIISDFLKFNLFINSS